VHASDYTTEYIVELAPIPAWQHLDEAARRGEVRRLVDEIEDEACVARAGRPVCGVQAVLRVPLERRTQLPTQPWFERRRRMICWSHPNAAETRAYLDRYWDFQRRFRVAARTGEHSRAVARIFPAGAFAPVQLHAA
jgi:AcrR family transcriptional regulator